MKFIEFVRNVSYNRTPILRRILDLGQSKWIYWTYRTTGVVAYYERGLNQLSHVVIRVKD